MKTEQLGYKEYKCTRCGWVHAAIPQSAVPADSDLLGFQRCFRCSAPSSGFVPAGEGDVLTGSSLQPVVVPGAWEDDTHGDALTTPQALNNPPMRSTSLPPPRRGIGEAVLYLDFDGVLHTQDCFIVRKQGPFVNPPHRLLEHMAVLEQCLAPYPEVRIVLSTNWVRRLGYIYACSVLSRPLRRRVVGATFHAQMDWREFKQLTRAEQVLGDVQRRCPRWWLALDDDEEGWPQSVANHLVLTDGVLGLGKPSTVEQLNAALEGSRST